MLVHVYSSRTPRNSTTPSDTLRQQSILPLSPPSIKTIHPNNQQIPSVLSLRPRDSTTTSIALDDAKSPRIHTLGGGGKSLHSRSSSTSSGFLKTPSNLTTRENSTVDTQEYHMLMLDEQGSQLHRLGTNKTIDILWEMEEESGSRRKMTEVICETDPDLQVGEGECSFSTPQSHPILKKRSVAGEAVKGLVQTIFD